MIHGFSLDHQVMAACMEPIFSDREGYQRIYIDLPGMGKTQANEQIRNSDDMLEVILAFIDRVIPDKRYLIIGESYGGYIARGVIEKCKERVSGAAFICPLIIPDHEKRNVPEHLIIFKDEGFIESLSKNEEEEFRSLSVVLDEYNWVRFQKEILAGYQLSDKDFLAKIKANYSFSFETDTELVEFPAVFLMGKQDSMVGYKDAFQLLVNYPRATFVVLDRAGHNLQIEQASLLNAHINEWLDRVNEHSFTQNLQ